MSIGVNSASMDFFVPPLPEDAADLPEDADDLPEDAADLPEDADDLPEDAGDLFCLLPLLSLRFTIDGSIPKVLNAF